MRSSPESSSLAATRGSAILFAALGDRTRLRLVARLSDAGIERMAACDADNPATKKQDWAKSFIGAPPL